MWLQRAPTPLNIMRTMARAKGGDIAEAKPLQSGVHLERFVYVGIDGPITLMEHQRSIAEFADQIGTMRRQHERPIATFFKQLIMTLLVEIRIADHDDLVNQVAVELDRKRQRECEPRPHAR